MSSEDPRERADKCGRELAAKGLFEADLAEEYDPDTWYEAEDGTHYCRREVWDGADDGRCIWHADVADKPVDALAAARSEGPERFDRAVLRESNLGSGVSLSECRLREAHLGRADLRYADLGGANLQRADLGGADFRFADLGGADFRFAVLGDADLRGADLTACKLGQTTFEDTTFDETTVFGARSGHEIEADAAAAAESWLATHVSSRFRALGRPSTDPDVFELAETQYRTVQRLRREHDLQQDPALEIQEKHARRKRALAEGRYWDWFKLAFYRWPMGYGEKPGHVVGTSLVVVGLSALLYPLFGLRVGKAGLTPATIGYPFDGVGLVTGIGKSVYFSVITFTTLGYGDVQPVGLGEAVATVESFVGALLMALLVFVLGRRATW